MDSSDPPKIQPPLLTSSNGASLLLYPMREVRAVVLRVMIRAGAWYEEPKRTGLLHLLEHMSFQGTRKFPTSDDLNLFEETHVISSNAATGGRSITFAFKFPIQSMNAALELLEERIFYPTFPEEELGREIQVIEQEYRDWMSSPMRRFEQKFISTMIGRNHLYSRSAIGLPEHVQTATRSELTSLHHKFFQPQQMVIGVIGRFEPDVVLPRLHAMLGRQTNYELIELPIVPPRPAKASTVFHRIASQSYGVTIRWLKQGTEEWPLKDQLALHIASYLLGVSHQARLFRELRQKLGLVYSVDCDHWYWPDIGIFEVSAATSLEHLDTVTQRIHEIVDEFLNSPIPDNDFKRAIHYMNLRSMMRFDSIADIADLFLNDLFYEGKTYLPEEYVQIASMLTESEVREVLSRFMTTSPFIGIVGPKNPWKI